MHPRCHSNCGMPYEADCVYKQRQCLSGGNSLVKDELVKGWIVVLIEERWIVLIPVSVEVLSARARRETTNNHESGVQRLRPDGKVEEFVTMWQRPWNQLPLSGPLLMHFSPLFIIYRCHIVCGLVWYGCYSSVEVQLTPHSNTVNLGRQP